MYSGAASAAQPASSVQMSVEVVEPMGSETWLYLSTGEHSLIARAGARANPQTGSSIAVTLDMGRAHFFDPQTETALV